MDCFSSPENRMEEMKVEAERLLAIISEQGGDMDGVKLAALRQQLNQCLRVVGVLNSDGSINLKHWVNFLSDMARKRDVPIKPEDYPSEEKFASEYDKLIETDPLRIMDISARGGKTIPTYLYGLGMVMSSKLVYESIFENDPITIRNGIIQNGRHRDLAREVLANCGYVKNWPWVRIESESE